MLPDLGIGQHLSLHGTAFFFLDDLVIAAGLSCAAFYFEVNNGLIVKNILKAVLLICSLGGAHRCFIRCFALLMG
jgi:hypothetical protein